MLIQCLTFGDVFITNDIFHVKKKKISMTDIGIHLTHILRFWRLGRLPPQRLMFSSRISLADSCLVICGDAFCEVLIFSASWRRLVATGKRCIFSSMVRTRGQNFAETHHMCKSSVKMAWHIARNVPASAKLSCTVNRLVDSHPDRGSSSTEVRTFLNLLIHSNVQARLKHWLPKAVFDISKVFASFCQRLKEITLNWISTYFLVCFIFCGDKCLGFPIYLSSILAGCVSLYA